MATQHPTERERRAIQRHADRGDEKAKEYLELLDTLTQVLEGSNGISLARGMVGEHNDVYDSAIDDALSELMPVIFRLAAAGWDSLKWYVPGEEKSIRIVNHYTDDQFEMVPAREILANWHTRKYWLSDARFEQYQAAELLAISEGVDDIASPAALLTYRMQGGMFSNSQGRLIEVDLDDGTCKVERVVQIDELLMVLKQEFEPVEEEDEEEE